VGTELGMEGGEMLVTIVAEVERAWVRDLRYVCVDDYVMLSDEH
jgi:hypothetical protein